MQRVHLVYRVLYRTGRPLVYLVYRQVRRAGKKEGMEEELDILRLLEVLEDGLAELSIFQYRFSQIGKQNNID